MLRWFRHGVWVARVGEFAGVDGEEDGCGGGVGREVVGDGSGVIEFLAGLAWEVDPQGRTDAVVVQGDADQAFLWPEAEGVPDEAEDIWGVLMVSFSMIPVPSPLVLL